MFRASRLVRRLFLLACVSVLGGVASAQTGALSTISGTVYSPLGPPTAKTTGGDPIPNILVFAVPSVLSAFPADSGPGGCTGPGSQAGLVPTTLIGHATSDAAGHFSFTIPSSNTSANIVIQAGKWRRQYPATAIAPGATTTLTLTMPGSSGTLADGTIADLPHIAIVTGSADAVECIFKRIGIATSEVTLPGAGGSINLYEGYENGGEADPKSTGSTGTDPTPSETVLESSTANLNAYDLVMFGCQGSAKAPEVTAATQQNLLAYANNGGRVFATHYGYVWLDTTPQFETAAVWDTSNSFQAGSNGVPDELVATIDTSYPEGQLLASWMQNVGGLIATSPAEIDLGATRVNLDAATVPEGVYNPPAQSWVSLNSASSQSGVSASAYAGTPSMQFTFDTPIGAAGVPTLSLSFTNSSATFGQGNTADSITVTVTNTSTNPTTAGLTLNLTVPTGITPTALMGVGNTGWVCDVSTLTCTRSAALGAADSDPVRLVFNVSPTAPLGQSTVSGQLTGGGLSNTSQCGRVLFNDYHVESAKTVTTGDIYPVDCGSGALTAQEKFLEFSLYNLSNFVAPTTTDTIEIQATPVITWPQPAGITYGTPLGATQLDATATGITGAALPGVFTYTPASGSVPAPGADTLSVSFAPTNALDYATATGTVTLNVTGVSLTSITPNSAMLDAPDTRITLTGSGFVTGAVIQINGTAVATAFVNTTSLTATIPAADLARPGALQITVTDPGVTSVSAALPFTVTAPPVGATLTGPSTAQPGSQPTLNFTLAQVYPVDIVATLTLGFVSSTTPSVSDPAILFANGTDTLTFTIAAGTVTVPTIQLQSGTVTGTITIPITLTADSVDVTPATLLPVTIDVPATVPTVSSATLTRTGNQLTVVVHGFSNTREMATAKFHFTPAAGASLSTTDLSIPAGTIFNTDWFDNTDASSAYGSTFTYTQVLNLSDVAATVGSIDIVLTNTVGDSISATAQ